jgi:hypothetical protein
MQHATPSHPPPRRLVSPHSIFTTTQGGLFPDPHHMPPPPPWRLQHYHARRPCTPAPKKLMPSYAEPQCLTAPSASPPPRVSLDPCVTDQINHYHGADLLPKLTVVPPAPRTSSVPYDKRGTAVKGNQQPKTYVPDTSLLTAEPSKLGRHTESGQCTHYR